MRTNAHTKLHPHTNAAKIKKSRKAASELTHKLQHIHPQPHTLIQPLTSPQTYMYAQPHQPHTKTVCHGTKSTVVNTHQHTQHTITHTHKSPKDDGPQTSTPRASRRRNTRHHYTKQAALRARPVAVGVVFLPLWNVLFEWRPALRRLVWASLLGSLTPLFVGALLLTLCCTRVDVAELN